MPDDLMPAARSVLFVQLYNDDAGRPVLRIACDCSIITDATVEIYALGEFAITCDGCQTTRWFVLSSPEVSQ